MLSIDLEGRHFFFIFFKLNLQEPHFYEIPNYQCWCLLCSRTTCQFLNHGNATETMLLDLELHLQLLHIQQVSYKCCVFDDGEHVCCVNMDLHFILQVFIELKLGPQLKDLINALCGRLLISRYTPSHQFGFSC